MVAWCGVGGSRQLFHCSFASCPVLCTHGSGGRQMLITCYWLSRHLAAVGGIWQSTLVQEIRCSDWRCYISQPVKWFDIVWKPNGTAALMAAMLTCGDSKHNQQRCHVRSYTHGCSCQLCGAVFANSAMHARSGSTQDTCVVYCEG